MLSFSNISIRFFLLQLFGSFDNGLDGVVRSGSVMDLNAQLGHGTSPSITPQEKAKHRYSFQGPSKSIPYSLLFHFYIFLI